MNLFHRALVFLLVSLHLLAHWCFILVYDDTKPEQIETLPMEAQHRPVDVRIVQADNEGEPLAPLTYSFR